MTNTQKIHRIYDNLYGYITLNKSEFDLVRSPLFQRLQWIKQLGPIHTVFPSALHSRYSHSLGVFHIIKKMMKHLEDTGEGFLNDREKDELRLAALLHDIGHIPLSHTGEIVLQDVYEAKRKKSYTKKTSLDLTQEITWRDLFEDKYKGSTTALHECLSAEVVLNDKEVTSIFEGYSKLKEYTPNKRSVAQLIVGTHPNEKMNSLLHSELDADRLDYLLRDSAFTGVGYGQVDLYYIIRRLIMPNEPDLEDSNCLCVDYKGLHTIEHYILARYFFYMQVVFNDRIILLDLLFSDVMKYMILNKSDGKNNWHLLDLNEFLGHIRQKKGSHEENSHRVYEYTDAQVFTKIRYLHDELDKKVKKLRKAKKRFCIKEKEQDCINDCAKMIMDAQVPGAIITEQIIVEVERDEAKHKKKNYASERRTIENEANKIVEKVAKELKLYKGRIKVDIRKRQLMKYTNIRDSKQMKDEVPNKEAVKIYNKNAKNSKNKIKFAAESNASILQHLVDKELLIFNVFYVKSSKHQDDNDMKKKIRQYFEKFVVAYFQSD